MKWFPLVVLLSLAFCSLPAWSTEQYARETGKSCIACHENPAGGGALTPEGGAFAKELAEAGKGRSLAHRIFRFGAGFIHLFIAILWFGTILYVHLVLKPAYAARGLPRGEMAVGLMSMVLIGVSGVILTLYRVSSWEILFETRFGILLLVKIALYMVMITSAGFVILFIGPKMRKKKEIALAESKQDLSEDELSQFDGRDGRPAYIAFRGIIYNVTGGKLWKEGVHAGRHHAGADLTEFLKQAPHGEDKVTSMPVVGRLTASPPAGRPLHEKVFYSIAYMNLGMVVAIIFVIALWRWW